MARTAVNSLNSDGTLLHGLKTGDYLTRIGQILAKNPKQSTESAWETFAAMAETSHHRATFGTFAKYFNQRAAQIAAIPPAKK